MDWTDCSVIEVVPGRMSGAPVLRGTRVRPEDLISNIEEGPEWMAEAFGLPIGDVREVLAFHGRHRDELPPRYTSPERIAFLGAGIDWTGCSLIEPGMGKQPGQFVVRHSQVRPEELVANRTEGEEWLAHAYRLPREAVRGVLAYYERHARHLAPAA